MATDFTVPAEWMTYADQVDEIAAVLRGYLERDDLWETDSIAASEVKQEAAFEALPFDHPVSTTLVHPGMALGQAMDHLVAMAAVLRTPRTIFSLMTLLRPLLVGAGTAHFLADTKVDAGERVRRAMNIELASKFELMMFYGRGTEGYKDYEQVRRDIAQGARKVWPHVTCPEPKKGGRLLEWFISPRPPGDMGLVREAMTTLDAQDIADSIYRMMSATTHAQPHALLAFVQPDAVTKGTNGHSSARLGATQLNVVTWLLCAASGLTGAVRRCCALYGWDPSSWEQTVTPRILEWNSWLEDNLLSDARRRTGLWLPGR